ncbi:MAG: helical backbone metal receptor [Calditrichia bacterium]
MKLIFCLWVIFFTAAFPGSAPADATRRIISLAPNITEMLYKLNEGDRLVGRTEFCTYPPQAVQIPSIGGYLNLDYEKVLKLQPDLVLQVPNADHRRKLEQLGIRVIDIPAETVEEIRQAIGRIADLLNCRERGRKVLNGMADTLAAVSAAAEKVEGSPAALLVVGRQPGTLEGLYVAGRNTFLDELWRMAGGRTAFPEVDQQYFPVSREDLLVTPIEFILEFHPGWQRSKTDQEKAWRGMNTLPAVKNDNLFLFTEPMYVIPGPRITQVALQFSEIIAINTIGQNQ